MASVALSEKVRTVPPTQAVSGMTLGASEP